MMKAQRQATLQKLLEDGKIESVKDAITALEEHGAQVPEDIIRCDFEDLGAVKIRDGHRVRYAPTAQPSIDGASFLQVLRNYVTSRRASGNMIVFRTPPGHANVVAAALDRSPIEGVLGIVAGDDTLFICVDDKLGAETVLKMIEKLEGEYR